MSERVSVRKVSASEHERLSEHERVSERLRVSVSKVSE